MLCEECHGVVLSVQQEREPVELQERVNGAVRTYVKRLCEKCFEMLTRKGAIERNPKGGAV
jgi:hypothetical protein